MADELERRKATLEVIRQLVIQILTLCASLLAAAVGFAKLFAPFDDGATQVFSGMLVAFSLSALLGLLALGAIISTLINSSLDVGYSRLVRWLTAMELLTFAVGLVLVAWFTFRITVPVENAPSTNFPTDGF